MKLYYLRVLLITYLLLPSFLVKGQENRTGAKKEISAETCLYWASEYHRKKIFDTAYFYYKAAAKLNPAYEPRIIVLLDDLQKWNEVIKIAAPIVNKGGRNPAHLGPLYTAYKETGDSINAEKTIELLFHAKYDEYENDYRYYILSYYYLWKGDKKKSLDFLKRIKSVPLKQYARDSFKFKILFTNQEFLEITK
jgi:hypothetical protein